MGADRRPEWEVTFLDDLYRRKRVNQATRSDYKSSTVPRQQAILGTVEADASGDFGRWAKEPFRSFRFAEYLCNFHDFASVLDVGAGDRIASAFFQGKGKSVVAVDFDTSPYIEGRAAPQRDIETLWGNFLTINLAAKFDLVWASHVLEHQPNVGLFIDRLIEAANPGGYLAITVPPRKPYIVSGHLNLFNPGLLVYRLVAAGIDCSDAKVFQQDGNISVLARNSRANFPALNYDVGDLELLQDFFPFPIEEGFNGDFTEAGLTPRESEFIFTEEHFGEVVSDE